MERQVRAVGLLVALCAAVFATETAAGEWRGPSGPEWDETLRTLRQMKHLEMETWQGAIVRGDRYVRTQDDFDALYYRLRIEVSISPDSIIGDVAGTFESLIDGLDEVVLDFDDQLTVDSLTGSVSGFQLVGETLTVDLDRAYNTGEVFEINTFYHGLPRLVGGVKGFNFRNHGGIPVVATLSTPFLAHMWWPCKDGPGDKPDSVDVEITIPDDWYGGYQMYASSNGVLESIVENGDGTRTFTWHEGYPVVPYYVMIAASNYAIFSDVYYYGTNDSMEVPYYVFPEDLYQAQITFDETVDMITFFASLFGEYPFVDEKYAMTQIGFYGAIENQTNTIMGGVTQPWYMIVVHELAHMWFGDMITCESWHHGWLNEGFATYCEALWQEHLYGSSAYHQYMAGLEYLGGGTIYLPDVNDPFGIFVQIIYDKGAWVLHMLRHVVGEETFFDILHAYSTDPAYMYGHATTEDFQQVCEEASGLDLDYFFEEWIYDEYYPTYRYSWDKVESWRGHMVAAHIDQVQSAGPIFTMPIDVTVTTAGGETTFVVIDSTESQDFLFILDETPFEVELDQDNWILNLDYQVEPAVTLELWPEATTLARGDTLRYTAVLTNTTAEYQSIDAVTEVTLPNGGPYAANPVAGPVSLQLSPGETRQIDVAHVVPLVAPVGSYRYTALIGLAPNVLLGGDDFTFQVVAGH